MAVYSDFQFNLNKTITNDIEVIENYISINQSIKNILFTNRGEVPFDPLFGSGLMGLLFEKMSPVTEILIKNEIIFAIKNYEPRVQINNIEMIPNYDGLIYEIDIEYVILKLNSTGSVQLSLQIQGL